MTHVTDLSKFIRIRQNTGTNTDGSIIWTDVLPNTVDLNSIVSVVGGWGKMTLTMPEMWGEYAVLTDDERDYHVGRVIDQLILLYVKASSSQSGAGAFDLSFSFHYPLRALFYNAVNMTAQQYNNYSNYTTDPFNNQGINPIASTSYYYDAQPRFENMPSTFPSDIWPYKHATRSPQDEGYNFIPYCMRLSSIQMDGWTEPNRIDTELKFTVSETPTNTSAPTFQPCNYVIQLRGICVNIIRYQQESLGFPSLSTTGAATTTVS